MHLPLLCRWRCVCAMFYWSGWWAWGQMWMYLHHWGNLLKMQIFRYHSLGFGFRVCSGSPEKSLFLWSCRSHHHVESGQEQLLYRWDGLHWIVQSLSNHTCFEGRISFSPSSSSRSSVEQPLPPQFQFIYPINHSCEMQIIPIVLLFVNLVWINRVRCCVLK